MILPAECSWWFSFHHLMVPQLLNYWSTKRSVDAGVDDLDSNDEDEDAKKALVCPGSPLVITLSSIVGIGTPSKDLQLDSWYMGDSFPMFSNVLTFLKCYEMFQIALTR